MITNKKFRKLVRNPRLFFSDFFRKRANQLIPNVLKTPKVNGKYRGKYRYSVISAVYGVEKYLDEYFASLAKQTLSFESHIELIMVDDGSKDSSAAIVKKWQAKYPSNIHYIRQENAGQASARNTGIPYATGDWVTFIDPDDFVDSKYFEEIDRFLVNQKAANVGMVSCNLIFYMENRRQIDDSHPLKYRFSKGDQVLPSKQLGKHLQLSASTAFFKQSLLSESGVRFDPIVKPSFEDANFVGRYLLKTTTADVGIAPKAKYCYRKRDDGTSTLDGAWSKPGNFDVVLRHGCLRLMEEAVDVHGLVPVWLQRTILYHLIWYINRIVAKPQSLAHLEREVLSAFRMLVDRIFEYIEPQTILEFELAGSWFFQKIGILGLFKGVAPPYQIAYIEDFDAIKRHIRVRYFFQSEMPLESFRLNGHDVTPVYAKTRVHKFMDEVFVNERIVWLAADTGKHLSVWLGGQEVRLTFAGSQYPKGLDINQIANRFRVGPLDDSAFPPHVRALRRLARRSSVKNRFSNAWLFMDSDIRADDSAEHLYRYVRANHPEVNCYFLLRKSSRDWARLKKEGFRLIPFDSLAHRLLLLNAKHLISSHADTYVVSYLKDKWYKDLLQYRFTFLQHGVIKDDLSSWLNAKKLDRFVTSSPRECESICGDGNRYKFSGKEVILTGLPRHDALLNSLVPTEKLILIMPTWRLTLVGVAMGKSNRRHLNPEFYESQYAKAWRSLLHSDDLRDLVERHGYEVAFFPHSNILPYLEWFDVPKYIQSIPQAPDGSMQSLFRKAAVMITDYSSVAFEMALLQKPTLYYQFDRDDVFSGGHTTEPGYFDYEKDAFGPIVCDQEGLLSELGDLMRRGCQSLPKYEERMVQTFAYRDGQNCRRNYEAIANLYMPDTDSAPSHDVLLRRAIDAFRQENWKVAEERWDGLLRLSPDQSPAGGCVILAAVKYRLGLVNQSTELLRGEQSALHPATHDKLPDDYTLCLAQAYRELRRIDEAKAVLSSIGNEFPECGVQLELANIAVEEGNWPSAIERYKGLVDSGKTCVPVITWLKLAEAKHRLGLHQDRLTDLTLYERKAGRTMRSRLLQLELHIETGQTKAALTEANYLFKNLAQMAGLFERLRLAKALRQIGLLTEAETSLPVVEGLVTARVTLEKAEICFAKKDWQALIELNRAEVCHLTTAERQQLEYLVASAFYGLALLDDALSLLVPLRVKQSDSYEVLVLCAQIAHDLGKWEIASELWVRVLEKHPETAADWVASCAAHALCMHGAEEQAVRLVFNTMKTAVLRDLRKHPEDVGTQMKFLQLMSIGREKIAIDFIDEVVN
jgi:glycosyltransferase involved in cell wall biosynthesis/CDP-glycerol glycerophosphotransferase (TagB/SpsB family)